MVDNPLITFFIYIVFFTLTSFKETETPFRRKPIFKYFFKDQVSVFFRNCISCGYFYL